MCALPRCLWVQARTHTERRSMAAGSKPPMESENANELSSGKGRSQICKRVAAGISIAVVVGFVSAKLFSTTESSESRSLKPKLDTENDPLWGCGLLGPLPGISETGETTAETQRFIDSLKKSSSFQKVSFWNWNLAPMATAQGPEYLSKDFLFMPEIWGSGVVERKWVRRAGETNFLDGNGKRSPAQMANIFLGMNEPDIQGSCMGNMFGTCVRPCTPQAVQQKDCPMADSGVGLPPAHPNSQGMCDCWSKSVATGVGFWPVSGCDAQQPLPDLWAQEPKCIRRDIIGKHLPDHLRVVLATSDKIRKHLANSGPFFHGRPVDILCQDEYEGESLLDFLSCAAHFPRFLCVGDPCQQLKRLSALFLEDNLPDRQGPQEIAGQEIAPYDPPVLDFLQG
eukprot:s72_g20.t1